MTHPEGTTIARITALAQSFPSIADVQAVNDWDALALDRWAGSASHGERLAIQFVLSVWDCHEKWSCGTFNPVEAYRTWDDEHWTAFQRWVEAPYTL
jgi:hypothetical protein|tara:strand:+ start:4817 stop:5107 length:291 start_codon:yes stop_codon:yes gene_type:complete